MTHVSLLPRFSLFKQRIRIHTILNWNTYHVCEENMIRGNIHVYPLTAQLQMDILQPSRRGQINVAVVYFLHK